MTKQAISAELPLPQTVTICTRNPYQFLQELRVKFLDGYLLDEQQFFSVSHTNCIATLLLANKETV